MKVTIIPADTMVIVNGRPMDGIDMSGLPADLHAVQYDSDLGIAEEEWQGDDVNTVFDDIAKYQVILDRWQASCDAVDNHQPTRDEALSAKLAEIDAEFNRVVAADFQYQGHAYTADYINIPGMAINCIILPADAPIPTVDGKWTTAELEQDGITPVRIPFTCSEFLAFAAAFAARRSAGYAVMQGHRTAVRTLAADQTKTPADIAGYDTTGWWT